jgi:DNA invertase Pin-like site-specific DNA recombinase
MATKLNTKRYTQIIPYLRTSTNDQRLGIDAQRTTVEAIAREKNCVIVEWYIEHESGKKTLRPELTNAIRHARGIGALLVVAKLDRLARNKQFLDHLYDGDVPIYFGDLPDVDGGPNSRMLVGFMATMAQWERERIAQRTSEALAELKAQGKVLGKPANFTQQGRIEGSRNSAMKSIEKAVKHYEDVERLVMRLHAKGNKLRQIADELNSRKIKAHRGGKWFPSQVFRVLNRSKGLTGSGKTLD